jgi:hypothetical protein
MRLPWPRNHPRGSFSPVFQGESCRQGSVPCVRRAGVVDLFARKRAPTSARRSPLAGDCFSPVFAERILSARPYALTSDVPRRRPIRPQAGSYVGSEEPACGRLFLAYLSGRILSARLCALHPTCRVVDLFARKRAPTSARRSPLAGDAPATRQKSTTGKPSKCKGRFVGMPQPSTPFPALTYQAARSTCA